MKNILKTAAFVTGVIVTGSAIAATDGVVGATSTGTLEIQVSVADAVRISGLTDITAAFDGTNDIVESRGACIYRNEAGGEYGITATGSGGSGAFTIDDSLSGGTTVIPYEVRWNGSATAMTSGTALTGLTGAHETSANCGGTTNTTVEVTVLATDLLTAPQTTLNGTLTLVVAPE